MNSVTIIGAGLAGCEASLTVARFGVEVRLYEMKPKRFSPAHKSPLPAELVCSNSFGSVTEKSASGLLKDEMRILQSAVMESAGISAVPAGQALAVDRNLFSQKIAQMIEDEKRITLIREEITEIPDKGVVIIVTGPLTSDALAESISKKLGVTSLYFYDAISPIVVAESIDMSKAYKASRYDKGGADYINLPLTKEQYHNFVNQLLSAKVFPYHDFEDAQLFEGCMPIEEMAKRGLETLAHGPMKPVGLIDPHTGKRPYAVVQLRAENKEGTLYNIVGFQTKMLQSEQDRILRMLPGLENAEFVRWGSMHRNTYLNAPLVLTRKQELKNDPRIIFAGQIVGVEGYLESSASGIIAGLVAVSKIKNVEVDVPPPTTIIGALLHRIESAISEYTPMNANWGILIPLEGKVSKDKRRKLLRERAIAHMRDYADRVEKLLGKNL